MPWYECRKGIYEIDEFDCSEIFVVEGEKRALVIDTGTGIGDLKRLIETRITDKPYDVVASHNHPDHLGGAGWFERIYIHENDLDMKAIMGSTEADGKKHAESKKRVDKSYEYMGAAKIEWRKMFAEMVRKHENKYYEYDPDRDICPWPKTPEFIPISDGHVFDLGGRKVTAYLCQGHTAGEMVFLDDLTGTLLCGDAFNCNWFLNGKFAATPRECVQIALRDMQRIFAMKDRYNSVFNFHHDFRGFGSSLSPDVMPNLIRCLEDLLNGSANIRELPVEGSPDQTQKYALYNNVRISSVDIDLDDVYE